MLRDLLLDFKENEQISLDLAWTFDDMKSDVIKNILIEASLLLHLFAFNNK